MWSYNNTYELCHHGIKGQKWGVRRFQDGKGRLTKAGENRYSDTKRVLELETSTNSQKQKVSENVHKQKKQKSSGKFDEDIQLEPVNGNTKINKKGLTDRQKTAIKIGAAVVVAGLATYGVYKYKNMMKKPIPDPISNNFQKHVSIGKKSLDDILTGISKDADMYTGSTERAYQQATKNLESYTTDWVKRLTDQERSAVVSYTGWAYNDMNKFLRANKGSLDNIGMAEPYTPTLVKNCKSALDKASFPKDVWTTRGSSLNSLSSMLGMDRSAFDSTFCENGKLSDKGLEVLKQYANGGTMLTDHAFMSTSTRAGKSSKLGLGGQVKYSILVPKGAKAMYVDPISTFQGSNENETLLQAGSRFILKDAMRDGKGLINIIMEMVVD